MDNQDHQKERKPLLYIQTANHVMEEIRKRRLQSHDLVPSEGEIAKLYGVSRMTAKLALQILEKKGSFIAMPVVGHSYPLITSIHIPVNRCWRR